jgi:hypothetical protein
MLTLTPSVLGTSCFVVVVASVVQDEEVVEWSENERSHLARPAEALVHTPVTTDRKTCHDLRPSCHHCMGLRG